MWAQYYDRDLQDVFAVQEEIARRITSALAVKLTKEEEKHMGRPYTSSEVAWEYFMRGTELARRFTHQDNANARALFEKAIDLDPEFARAYASLAATHRQDFYGRWTQDPQSSENMAYRMAQKAVELARRELEPSLRCHMLSNKWDGFSCTERNIKRPRRRQRRRSNAIPTTRMAMPYGRLC